MPLDETLTPLTLPADRRDAKCWINCHPLPAGGRVWVDLDGCLVCPECAEHCVTCTDSSCAHPRYVYGKRVYPVPAGQPIVCVSCDQPIPAGADCYEDFSTERQCSQCVD